MIYNLEALKAQSIEKEALYYLTVVVCAYKEQVLPYILLHPFNGFIPLEEIIYHINSYGLFFLDIDKFRKYITMYRKKMTKAFGWTYDDVERRRDIYYIKGVFININASSPNYTINYPESMNSVQKIIENCPASIIKFTPKELLQEVTPQQLLSSSMYTPNANRKKKPYLNANVRTKRRLHKSLIDKIKEDYGLSEVEENQILKESIIRSFKDTGCVPNYPDVNNTYKQYSDTTQYSSRGMAVTPERSSPIERIEEIVAILEDEDDPDDIILDDNIDVGIEAVIAEAMIEPLDYDVSMNAYIDEVDESEDDTDNDNEDDFEFREEEDDED